MKYYKVKISDIVKAESEKEAIDKFISGVLSTKASQIPEIYDLEIGEDND